MNPQLLHADQCRMSECKVKINIRWYNIILYTVKLVLLPCKSINSKFTSKRDTAWCYGAVYIVEAPSTTVATWTSWIFQCYRFAWLVSYTSTFQCIQHRVYLFHHRGNPLSRDVYTKMYPTVDSTSMACKAMCQPICSTLNYYQSCEVVILVFIQYFCDFIFFFFVELHLQSHICNCGFRLLTYKSLLRWKK